MIKILMGEKGSGKTKAFIDMVNKAADEEHGNVVCITKGNRHLFDLKSSIRLLNTTDFKIDSYDIFAGFISGVIARDFDITHIFIDSLTKITGADIADSDSFFSELELLSKQFNIKFTLAISASLGDATDKIKPYIIEL